MQTLSSFNRTEHLEIKSLDSLNTVPRNLETQVGNQLVSVVCSFLFLSFSSSSMFSVITTPWQADIWVHLSEESSFPSGSLSQEDSLEKEMATHSRILPWEIPWRATVQGVAKESDTP